MRTVGLTLLIISATIGIGLTQESQFNKVVKITPQKIYVQVRSGKAIKVKDHLIIIRPLPEGGFEKIADGKAFIGGSRFAEVKIKTAERGKTVEESDLVINKEEWDTIKEGMVEGTKKRTSKPFSIRRQETSIVKPNRVEVHLKIGMHNILNKLVPVYWFTVKWNFRSLT